MLFSTVELTGMLYLLTVAFQQSHQAVAGQAAKGVVVTQAHCQQALFLKRCFGLCFGLALCFPCSLRMLDGLAIAVAR